MRNNKVLIAEDDLIMALLLQSRLEMENYIVLVANDGREAIKLIEKESPDVIISDIMMPYISGLEIVNHVKNVLKEDIPIALFSNSGKHKKMIEKATNMGVNDFFSKPLDLDNIILYLEKTLSLNNVRSNQ